MFLGYNQTKKVWMKGPNSILKPKKGLNITQNTPRAVPQALYGCYVTAEGSGLALPVTHDAQ